VNARDQVIPGATALAAPFSGAQWLDVQPRHACLPQLDAHVLLHAGPPFKGAAPVPVRQAAIQAMLFEKLAPDAGVAQMLLASGVVRLEPAQNHGVVTPLAQVVSHSMPLAVVGDARLKAYAPLSEGPAPALRFGSLEAAALQRLHEVSQAATALRTCVRVAPVDMAVLIETALANGDECHSRTGAANNALLEAMPGLDTEARKLISGNPGFVLPVMMAAACWALHQQAAPIVMAGGNGIEFGLRLRGADAWRSVPATAPVGTRFPAYPAATVLGAIGDSAVLDFCGLGGQALAFAPALLEEWKEILPLDAARRRLSIIDDKSGAVDPLQVQASGLSPIVHLAMLDRGGSGGLLGRGFYIPPVDLFNT
jgi:hypothetical protein